MKRTTYAIRGNSKYSIEIPAQPSKLREKRVKHNKENYINRCGYNIDKSVNNSEGEE